MIDATQILQAMASNREPVPMHFIGDYVNSEDPDILMRCVFSSRVLPVAPSLCFFETVSSAETAVLRSFYQVPDPHYEIVPFGNVDQVTAGLGISYNVFSNLQATQNYTICLSAGNISRRRYDQNKYFKENFRASNQWTAGHLLAHQYSPECPSPATQALFYNFIPEPSHWNCYQRSHIENQSYGQHYSVYPMYSLRYRHGRTVKPYNKLSYRPIPDGVFFDAITSSSSRKSVYIPFVSENGKIYDSSYQTKGQHTNKVTRLIEEHKVNSSALPTVFKLNCEALSDNLDARVQATELTNIAKTNNRLATEQTNLFSDNANLALHHAAVIRYERAAASELTSPLNKLECAMTFSSLANIRKTSLYLSVAKQHCKMLLDNFEAEDSCSNLGGPIVSAFKRHNFTQCNLHEELTDMLERLRPKHS